MTALVVDDEAPIRRLVSKILELNGYTVLEAEDGFKALELANQHKCDLVITDFAMPGMNGGELIGRLQDEGYRAGYLIISGFAAGRLPQGVKFLAKPFTQTQLLTAVQELEAPVKTVQELGADLRQARNQWAGSMTEFDEIVSDVPSGLPEPDGSLRIEQASRKRSEAFRKFRDALGKYRDALKSQNSDPEGEGRDA